MDRLWSSTGSSHNQYRLKTDERTGAAHPVLIDPSSASPDRGSPVTPYHMHVLTALPEELFSLRHLVAYTCYLPLLLAGPLVTFSGFAGQINAMNSIPTAGATSRFFLR